MSLLCTWFRLHDWYKQDKDGNVSRGYPINHPYDSEYRYNVRCARCGERRDFLTARRDRREREARIGRALFAPDNRDRSSGSLSLVTGSDTRGTTDGHARDRQAPGLARSKGPAARRSTQGP